jgi:hypothetical protein
VFTVDAPAIKSVFTHFRPPSARFLLPFIISAFEHVPKPTSNLSSSNAEEGTFFVFGSIDHSPPSYYEPLLFDSSGSQFGIRVAKSTLQCPLPSLLFRFQEIFAFCLVVNCFIRLLSQTTKVLLFDTDER